METKTCTKCKETKTVDLFYKRSDLPGKYTSNCKACKRAHDTAHSSLPETKAKRSEYSKKLRSTPEYKAKEFEYKYTYNRLPEVKEAKKLKQRIRRLNPDVVKQERLHAAEYAKANPEKFAMKTRKRKVAKLQRTPFWFNSGQEFEMECIYKYCAALRSVGLDYEVDHIVPMQGKTVSGLHVPWNLQILTASENAAKGNRLW
jgi:5-methylcytosine-specific restriction endonuclease McrA